MIIPAALFVARRRAALRARRPRAGDEPRGARGPAPAPPRAHGRVVCTLFLAKILGFTWPSSRFRFRGRAAVLCLFDKATRPRDRPRRTALTVMSLAPRRATRSRRGQVRSCTRVLAYYAHRVRDVIRSQARVRVPICIPVLDISYTERRQVPRHWEERRAELGGPVHDPRLRATHHARATGTRMPVEDECHRRSW